MNPWSVVDEFERVVAEYGGSHYGVAVDSCTNSLFLCGVYCRVDKVELPTHTYVGVAQSIINSGGSCNFLPYKWQGCYRLTPYPIYDSARRFRRDMAREREMPDIKGEELLYYYCLSFQAYKHLPIGRGGMVLTNDVNFVEWAKKARFDGRTPGIPPKEDTFIRGYHMMLEPEFALRGLRLMEKVRDYYPDLPNDDYADLSKQEVFK
jgi:dTDP-4-amino-4,6-dideoxygalactose transaminase